MPMKTYFINAKVIVSCRTHVVADSAEAAMEIAKNRSMVEQSHDQEDGFFADIDGEPFDFRIDEQP